MKASDIEKALELINGIQEYSNRIEGIKKYSMSSQNCLYIDSKDGYFNGFFLTKKETENIICRLENERLSLIEKLKELGVEMD